MTEIFENQNENAPAKVERQKVDMFLLGRYKTCNRVRLQAFVAEPTAAADKILQIGGVYTLMPKIRLV